MKILATCLILTFLFSAAACTLSFKPKKDDPKGKPNPPRRIVLVPKTVYVPVYTSDGSSPLEGQKLSPIGPVLTQYAVAGAPGASPPVAAPAMFDYSALSNFQPSPTAYSLFSSYPQQIPPPYSAYPYYGVPQPFHYMGGPMDQLSMLPFPAAGFAEVGAPSLFNAFAFPPVTSPITPATQEDAAMPMPSLTENLPPM